MKPNKVVKEEKVESTQPPQFSKEEWEFIQRCIEETTIKAKDAATVANILMKVNQNCK